MSVLTYHEVSNDNGDVFDRLEKEGIIHPGKIYSHRQHEYITFKYVFDYTKCDKETLRELDERIKKADDDYWKDLQEDETLTETQRAYKFGEVKKTDAHLLPVSRTKRGGVAWILNYSHDDLPSVAIGRKFPDEVLDYFQETEGHVDSHVRYKEDTDIENFLMKKYASNVKSVNLIPDEKEQEHSNKLEKR